MPIVQQTPPPTPLTRALARRIADLRGPCIGCKDCRGLCHELIEMLSLPETILTPKDRAP